MSIASNLSFSTATSLLSGSVGALPYQNAASSTAFLPLGTAGFVLTAGASAPQWSSIGALTINTATNIAGGTAGQIHYQSSPGITAFAGPGTAGQILVSAGATAPVYTSTGSIYVNTAVFTDNVRGGATGSLHYQTAANATGMLALSGTVNSLLVAGASAPQYVIQVQATSGTGSASAATGQSLVVTAGGLGVTGNSYFLNDVGVGGNTTLTGTLRVNSTNANTGTNTSNALYTAGGAWIDKTLVVAGPTTFRDTVSFLGTATYVYSTNTVITDNIVNVHGPVGSTPDSHVWTLDDGFSIGQIYHYYKGADKDAFLGWNNATTYLEWWENGTALGNGYTGTTLGSFRTGNVILASGVNATNTTSGSLQITNGGAGIGGSVFIGGNLTVLGTINATLNGTITSATNIVGGTAGQIHYQTAPGLTGFAGPGTAGQILVSAGATAPVYTNTSSIYVNSARFADEITGGGNGSLVYQANANDTQFLSTGTPGQLLSSAVGAPTWINTSSLLVGFTVNDSGGAAGSIRYQSGANASTFLAIGTAGTFITSNGTAPVWSSTSTALIGYAQNVAGGTTGQLHYQSAANTTAFVGPGTAGQLLVSAGASAPVYTNTSSIFVNSARFADNLTAGAAGSMPYQSAANATTMLAIGLAGYVLQSNGTSPIWSPLSGISAGQATTATNLAFGTAGQVPYQTGPGATSFYGPGTAGQLLVSAGAAAPTYVSTSAIYVNSARFSDNDTGGSAGSLRYQTAANASTFLGLGTAGQFLTAGASAPQWTSTSTALIGYAQNLAGGAAGQFVYQSAANTTAFISTSSMFVNSARFADELTGGAAGSIPYQVGANDTSFLAIGTNGFVLTSNGTAPTWQAISGLSAGSATTATNLAGGTAGQVPYQTGPGGTAFFGPGTAGQLLQSNGAAAPSYLNTTSVYVGRSIYADDIFGGGSGALHYQAAPNDTQFLSTGTQGNILVSQPGAPVFTSTATFLVGSALNVAGGTAGQLHIQSSPGVTAFAGPGTAGQLLVSAGAATPVYTNTSSISVGFGANILGGAAGSLPYQTAANATGMLAIGTNGFVLTSNGSAPTWAAVSGLTAGNATNAANIATIQQTASGTYYPTFVNANNATSANMQVFTTSTFSINPATGVVGINGVGGTALNITVPSTITDRYFINATAAVNSFSIYDNANTPYINSYAGMSFRANQMGGTGGSINLTGGNVFVGSNLGVGQASPSQKLEVAGAIKVAGTAATAATLGTAGAVLDYTYPTTRMYIGDGSGWDFRIARRATSVTTDLFTFSDTGGLGFAGSFGSSGQFLQSNGSSSPTWVNASGVGVGNATTASQLNTVATPVSASHFITFVDSNNATGTGELYYTTSSFTVNPASGLVTISGPSGDGIPILRVTGTAAPAAFNWAGSFMNSSLGTSRNSIILIGQAESTKNCGYFGFNHSGTAGSNNNFITLGHYGADNLVNLFGDGSFQIGSTSNQGYKLYVNGTSYLNGNARFVGTNISGAGTFTKSTNAGEIQFDNGTTDSPGVSFYYANNLNFGLDTSTYGGSQQLRFTKHVNETGGVVLGGIDLSGNMVMIGEITAYYSDRRLKTNVKPIDNALDKVLSLNGITYTPNELAGSFGFDTSKQIVGLFADEVEAVLPEATKPAPFDLGDDGTSKSGENYKTVQYEKVVPLLVEAIKDQQKQIAQLTEMVKLLTNK